MTGAAQGRGPRTTVSVAMATFNGARYLGEQLASLARQSATPDELVVVDDASVDGTPALLESFAATAPFPVRVQRSARNGGVNAAFSRAMAACTGDLVFPCDQDDVWAPDKIAVMRGAIDRDPAAGFAFCDARQIDASGRPLPRSLWEQVGFTPRRRRLFAADPMAALLRGPNVVYGMASAYRRDLLARFLPVAADPAAMTHDTWLALHLVGVGARGVVVDRRLVDYRRHAGQVTSGPSRPGPANRDRERLRGLVEALEAVRSNVAAGPSAGGRAARELDARRAHVARRIALRDSRSASAALLAAVSPGYWRYASGPLSAARDWRGW